MSLYSPNREERAFLYQEAQDLQPLAKSLGSLSVMVETLPAGRKQGQNRFRVTFMVAPESVGMQIQATDRNLFEATIAAKEEAIRQLNALINALPPAEQLQLQGEDFKIPPEMLH